MAQTLGPEAQAYYEALKTYGHETMGFEGLKSGMRYFVHQNSHLAYHDTGHAWVAVGLAIGPQVQAHATHEAFVAAALRAKRRPLFFGAQTIAAGMKHLHLGLQPVWEPKRWPETLKSSASLREQIRRARKKGVTVREIVPLEWQSDSALRAHIDTLAQSWLAKHPLKPLGFVVHVEPFYASFAHRYWVLEHLGQLVGFASVVPIGPGQWLLEDLFRAPTLPNGSTELLFDALMQTFAEAERFTLGLAPLSGPLPWWLAGLRTLSRPLYDFRGLEAFRRRLRPTRWEPVYLLYPKGSVFMPLWDTLSAFAQGSMWRYALGSLWRHPGLLGLGLGVGLALWMVLLVVLALSGQANVLAMHPFELWAWIGFDAVLLGVFARLVTKPRLSWLKVALGLSAFDAVMSLRYLVLPGFSESGSTVVLRSLTLLAPLAATWCLVQSLRAFRKRKALLKKVKAT